MRASTSTRYCSQLSNSKKMSKMKNINVKCEPVKIGLITPKNMQNELAKYWYDRSLTMEQVADVVMRVTKVGRDDFYGNSRKMHAVNARAYFVYMMRVDARLTWGEISKHISKNHATCIYYVRRLDGYLEYDLRHSEMIETLRTELFKLRAVPALI